MKIMCLYGSPMRKGNSATLADAFLDTMRERGATVETFRLYKMAFGGCTACMACKNGRADCALRDDLSPVLAGIPDVDLLVLATPIYDQDVTASMKAFVERTHSFLESHGGPVPGDTRIDPGKKVVFVFAQGNTPDMHTDVYLKYRAFFRWYGFDDAYLLRACEVIKPGDILKQPEILASAKELAGRLLEREGG